MLFITGITGHTGKWFLDKLVREKYQGRIRCLVRENSDVAMLKKSGLDIDIVHGDLEDVDRLSSYMKGATILVHIATILFSNNVMEAAVKNDVQWAILVHTTGRYSKFKSASCGYIDIEDGILKKHGQMDVTILRPTMIYGSSLDRNMYRLIGYLDTHKFFPIFGRGDNLMQPVHARDLGCAYYQVLMNQEKTKNKEYNLAGKMPIRYIDLVKCVSETLGASNRFVHIPLWLSVAAAKVFNAITTKAIISVEQVLRMQEDKAFSYEEATNDFGYAPIAFEEGIREEVAEYVENVRKRDLG